MARTKTEADIQEFAVTEVVEKNTAELAVALDANDMANAIILDKFDLIKSIGRMEMAGFVATVADKVIVETFLSVKKSKAYKDFPYKKDNGEVATVATLEEFCQVFFDKSYRRCQEIVANYNLLGEELYEHAERIGFRQRDYNALKALPADDRQLIAQAIEEENLDKALDLMQEMAAKHLREKEQLTKQAEELTHTIEAKDKVIKDKTGVIDTQAEKLALLETKQKSTSPEQRLIDARANLQIAAANVKAMVMADLRRYLIALNELPGNHDLFAAGLLAEIGRELNVLRDEYNLPATISDDILTDPTWAAVQAELQG